MMFVAGQIFAWMALAFVIGVAVGWAAHVRRGGRTTTTKRRFR